MKLMSIKISFAGVNEILNIYAYDFVCNKLNLKHLCLCFLLQREMKFKMLKEIFVF